MMVLVGASSEQEHEGSVEGCAVGDSGSRYVNVAEDESDVGVIPPLSTSCSEYCEIAEGAVMSFVFEERRPGWLYSKGLGVYVKSKDVLCVSKSRIK